MLLIRLCTLLLFAATLTTAQQTSAPKSAGASISEPKLPVIDYNACPGKGRIVPNMKIERSERMYSSWREKRVSVGALEVGEKVTVLAGINVIHEPDRALVRRGGEMALAKGESLKAGDVVLIYGFHADGDCDFWAKGVWYTESHEFIAGKDDKCGFADKSQCTVVITRNGATEWWVQVKNSSGSMGWVLADKSVGDKHWNSGNFGELCFD